MKPAHNFDRWEPSIQAFEAEDREQPPQPGGVLFIGSSTMRMWKTSESFPDLRVVNRGFGGCEMIDVLHFARRIAVPHKPRVMLVYAGSNDLAKQTQPCEIAAQFSELVETMLAASPETEIVFLSIKPTVKRWGLMHRVRAANALIEALAVDLPRVHYLDVHTPMLNDAGEPDVTCLAADGLHLNAKGYERLTKLVRPEIDRLLAGGGDVAPPSLSNAAAASKAER